MPMDKDILLHIHAQEYQHNPAYIIGNRDGLLALKTLIEQALENGDTISANRGNDMIFTADGEGYEVVVVCDDHDWQTPNWQERVLPYTDDSAMPRNENNHIEPWIGVSDTVHKQLIGK